MVDWKDPVKDPGFGVIQKNLIQQGGAEEILIDIVKEFDCAVYTNRYNPEVFSEEFREIVGPKIIEISDLQTSNEERNGGIEGITGFCPVEGTSFEPGEESTNPKYILSDYLLALDVGGMRICSEYDIPFVSYIHHTGKTSTDYFWDILEQKPGLKNKLKWVKKARSKRKGYKKAAKDSEYLLANSERTKKRIKQDWKVSEDKIEVCYPPVDTDFFGSKVKSEKMVDYGRYFLAPQRLESYKNIHLLVGAAKEAEEHLVIVGSGKMEDYMRRETQNSRYIHYLGYVEKEELRNLYVNAEATVQATLREDFGLVPPESMAAATPCIVPASGGFLETVSNGYEEEVERDIKTDYGLLIDSTNFSVERIAKAFNNFDKSNYSERKLKKRAENFSKEKFYSKIEKALDKLDNSYDYRRL